MLPVVPNADALSEEKWRKRVGLVAGERVFTCNETGFYADVRRALLARGWREAPWGSTPHWSMMLTLKAKDVPHASLKPGQSANHFLGSSSFCTKAGLLRCLEGAHGHISASPARFSPRAYDLDDPAGYATFVDEFRCVAAEAVLREAAVLCLAAAVRSGVVPAGALRAASGGGGGECAPFEEQLAELLGAPCEGAAGDAWEAALGAPAVCRFVAEHAAAPRVNLGVLAAALAVTARRVPEWGEDATATGSEPHLISEAEWSVLRYCSLRAAGGPSEQAAVTLRAEAAERDAEAREAARVDKLLGRLAATGAVEEAKAALAEAGGGAARAGGGGGSSCGGGDGGGGGSSSSGSDGEEARSARAAPRAGASGARAQPAGAGVHSRCGGGGGSGGGGSAPPSPRRGMCGGGGAALSAPGAAATVAQLSQWRARAERDAPSPALAAAAAGAYAFDVGDPPPGSGGAAPLLAALAPVPAATWASLVRSLRRVNGSPDCQSALNAAPAANVWIAKPSGKSRGRGIVCEKRLSRLLWRQGGEGGGSALGKSAAGGGYIVQKYIERPLLVHARKFDIRQWVLVTSWAPLEVWMYRRCYARFCAWPYALGDVGNKFAHLSNNSVQKHSAAFAASGIEGNMWLGETLAAWVQARAGEGAWEGVSYAPLAHGGRGAGFQWGSGGGGGDGGGDDDDEPPQRPISGSSAVWDDVVRPQVRALVIAALMAAQDGMTGNAGADACWEHFGFDVMLDAGLRAWLIEVNSTPDMWYTTAVTEELVKEASEGMVAVLCEGGYGCPRAPRRARGGGRPAGAPPPPPQADVSVGGWDLIYAAPPASAAPIPAHRNTPAAGLALAGAALSAAQLAAMATDGGSGGGGRAGSSRASSSRASSAPRAAAAPAGAPAPPLRPPAAAALRPGAPVPSTPRAAGAPHVPAARARAPLQPALLSVPLREGKVDFAPPALAPPRAASNGRAPQRPNK
jgi:hypothetical protein